MIFVVERCVILLPFHFCVKALPKEFNIFFRENGEKKCFNFVE